MSRNNTFQIRRDVRFTSVETERLNTSNAGATTLQIQNSRDVVTSGSWDIAFEEAPPEWENATIFLSSARYMCIAGTQHLQVTGYVTMDATADPGIIAFTTPFRTSGDTLFGGTSSCSNAEITEVVPSVCNCINGGVVINILPVSPLDRINFSASVLADIV